MSETPPSETGHDVEGHHHDDRRAAGGSRGRLWVWVAMAATLTAMALSLKTLMMQQEISGIRAELRVAESRATNSEALRDSISRLVGEVSGLLDGAAVELVGTSVDSGARALAYVDPGSRVTKLLVAGLSALPDDRLYQLWAIAGDDATSLGTFSLASEESSWVELVGASGAAWTDRLVVTVESAPGASSPTTPPVLAGGS